VKLKLTLVCSLFAIVALGCDEGDLTDEETIGPPSGIFDAGRVLHGRKDAGGTEQGSIDAGGSGDDVASCGVINRSVACTGPGGCAGGQICQADGSFGECACGAEPPAPTPTACSPQGVLAACLGKDACGGLQVCGGDGSFGTCQCPKPTTDPDRAVTGLEITSPLAGESVAALFEVRGTAKGHVAAVYVSIGGGPLLLADGTTKWSLRFDPGTLPYGALTIVARAVGEDGGELQRWIQVYNIDPLVGTWRRTKTNWYGVHGRCLLVLKAGGGFLTQQCPSGPLSPYITWQRLHDDVVAFNYSYSDPSYTTLATLSQGGEKLVITSGSASYQQFKETFVRISDDEYVDRDGGAEVIDDVDSGGGGSGGGGGYGDDAGN
jgi:hypothetical protein